MAKASLFQKPAGGSERIWNNQAMGVLDEVTCEACGTKHPELSIEDSSRIVDSFLGLQIVEECCGRAVDVLYEEFGEEFCIAFLEDFAEDPISPRFGFLAFIIKQIAIRARERCDGAIKTINELEKITA